MKRILRILFSVALFLVETTAYAGSNSQIISVTSPLSINIGNISLAQAGVSTSGYLSSSDWNRFNNGIGSSGTVTSVALSLPGIFTVSGSPVTTSGTLTAVLANQTANLFLASPSNTTGSPSFRNIAAADLPTIQVTGGGTGATSANAGFNALSPMTSSGDLIYGGASGAATRLQIGTTGYVLTVAGGLPTWAAVSGTGTVTSVGVNTDTTTSSIFANTVNAITGSPVTTSGSMTLTLSTQSANTVLSGPTTGSAAAPAFRALVSADIPDISSTYSVKAGNSSLITVGTISSGTWNGTTIAVANGGTGLTGGTSGGIPYYSASNAITSSGVLTNHAIVLGGGAGASPTALGSLGTSTTVLHGAAAGAPTFGAVSLTADVSGVTPVANGGTNSSTSLNNNRVMQSSAGAIIEASAITASRGLCSDSNGIPIACSSGPSATEMTYVTGLTSAAQTQIDTKLASTGFIEEWTGQIETVSNKTYYVIPFSLVGRKVVSARLACGTSGTVTVALKVDGTNITTCNGIAVTSTPGTTTCDTGSTSTLAANSILTIATTSNSTCLDFYFDIKTTRQ